MKRLLLLLLLCMVIVPMASAYDLLAEYSNEPATSAPGYWLAFIDPGAANTWGNVTYIRADGSFGKAGTVTGYADYPVLLKQTSCTGTQRGTADLTFVINNASPQLNVLYEGSYVEISNISISITSDTPLYLCNGTTVIGSSLGSVNMAYNNSIASGVNTVAFASSGGQIGAAAYKTYTGTATTAPVSIFNATPESGPASLYVLFDDASTGVPAPDTWNWSITPTTGVTGYLGNTRNHSASFATPGNYTVSHGVSNTVGSSISTKNITVYNATSDYVTTGFAAMDKPRWVQLAGATINLYDVGNGTWKNASSSTTGYEEITTLANSTINAYASMTGYSDISLTGKAPWNGGTYTLEMLPTGYANVSAGNVTLYVTVWGSDTTSRISGAAVNRVYIDPDTGQQMADYRITDKSGIVSFVVPNQTLIYLYAEKAGYAKAGTTINSGDGDGGEAAVYTDITLQRLYVTTAPTPTTLPGGGTPTTQQTVDPYPCDADHPENCQRKQTDLANTVIVWAPDLVNLFILATIFGVFTMMMKGIK